MVQRLNWGCGLRPLPHWTNSDIQYALGVDVVADIRQGLPLPDASFDYIVSIHALPELSYAELDPALRELHRLLKPGGVLRLGLPDMHKAIEAYLARDPDYFLVPDDDVRSLGGKMIVQLTWYGRSRTMFTYDFMEELLARNDFQETTRCGFQETRSLHPEIVELDDRQYESLFVESRRGA